MVFDVMEPSCTEGNEFSALEYMLEGVKMVSEVLGMSRSTAYYCPNGRVCHRLQSVNLFV